VFSHEILYGKPYTFLDDAPLEERRTRAVQLRRGLPLEAKSLAELDPAAVERVRAEAVPEIRDGEELHDLLLSLVVARPFDDPVHRALDEEITQMEWVEDAGIIDGDRRLKGHSRV